MERSEKEIRRGKRNEWRHKRKLILITKRLFFSPIHPVHKNKITEEIVHGAGKSFENIKNIKTSLGAQRDREGEAGKKSFKRKIQH